MRSRFRRAWLGSLAPLVLLIRIAAATDTAEPRGDLTLTQSIATALANSPELQSAEYELRASDARTLQAGLRPNPELAVVIQLNAERMRTVTARFAGVVKTVTKRIGDAVHAGDILATVESNDSLQTYAVTAPIAGIVTARDVNPGETVSEKALFTVADLSTVWVELAMFPNDLARVKVGQNVQVKSVDAGLTGSGRIVWVSLLGASESQSVTARVLLENRSHQWKPGLYVSGEVVLSEASVPLTVRATAVQSVEGQTVVFVRNARGYEVRPVKLGRHDSEVIEVLEGLKTGEPYVSAGSFLVKAELGKAGAKDED